MTVRVLRDRLARQEEELLVVKRQVAKLLSWMETASAAPKLEPVSMLSSVS